MTIFESELAAGGILRWGIPKYRLPLYILEREIEFLKELGVNFRFNTTVGVDISIEELETNYSKIVIAIGAHKDIPLNIKGNDIKGVLFGSELLKGLAKGEVPQIGKRVAVIGGGNVAVDSARTLLRLGSEVTVVYRRVKSDMPANRDEIKEAEIEGVEYLFLSSPREILADVENCVRGIKLDKMCCGEIDLSNRRKPLPTGHSFILECDTVVIAVGEEVESSFLAKLGILSLPGGNIKVEPFTYKSNNPKVYAIGDAVTGPSTASEAMGAAKRAAKEIDLEVTGKKRFHKLFRSFEYSNIVPSVPEGGSRHYSVKRPLEERRGNFEEVNLGYTHEQAFAEAARCLRCDVNLFINSEIE